MSVDITLKKNSVSWHVLTTHPFKMSFSIKALVNIFILVYQRCGEHVEKKAVSVCWSFDNWLRGYSKAMNIQDVHNCATISFSCVCPSFRKANSEKLNWVIRRVCHSETAHFPDCLILLKVSGTGVQVLFPSCCFACLLAACWYRLCHLDIYFYNA